jgi:hypothetical protein
MGFRFRDSLSEVANKGYSAARNRLDAVEVQNSASFYLESFSMPLFRYRPSGDQQANTWLPHWCRTPPAKPIHPPGGITRLDDAINKLSLMELFILSDDANCRARSEPTPTTVDEG